MTPWLMTLIFALHLLCVNVASAGPLVAALFDFLEGRGSSLAGRAGRFLAAWGVALLLPGGLFGLVLGWHYWDDAYQAVLARLANKIYFGVWELAFSLVLMVGQLAWWWRRPGAGGVERGLRIVVALLASTNLLYHFPTLFAVIEQTATSGVVSEETITPSQFRGLIVQPAVLARVAHFVLAAVATCGVVLLGFALRLGRRNVSALAPEKATEHHRDVQQVAAWGAQLALLPSLMQIPVGLWLTASLERPLQSAVTGNDMLATTLLLVSVLLAFAMMHTLATIAIGDASSRLLLRAMVLMLLVIVLMSGTLQRLRALAREASERVRSTSLLLDEAGPASSAHEFFQARKSWHTG